MNSHLPCLIKAHIHGVKLPCQWMAWLSLIWLAALGVMSACAGVPRSDGVPPALTATETLAIAAVQNTVTPMATLAPTITATSTQATPTATPAPATATPSATPTPVEPVSGRLVMADATGIRSFPLPDGESSYLLHREATWLDWEADFGLNKGRVAYWAKYTDHSEVWAASLSGEWRPERVAVVNLEFDAQYLNWAVNDRYLLFTAYTLDESSILEDYIAIGTYIFDVQAQQLVVDGYWPGECMILAPSPQTGQVALWCDGAEIAPTQPRQYLVLEPEASPWMTDQAPEPLIDNCHPAMCDWSADGEYVVYIVEKGVPHPIFYMWVDRVMPVRLDDGQTTAPSFPLWSPDSQYFLYTGACLVGLDTCPNVMSIEDQEVLWRTMDQRRDEGLQFFHPFVWSPDSRYLALSAFDLLKGGNLFVLQDILAGQEVGRVRVGDNQILDAVWLEAQ